MITNKCEEGELITPALERVGFFSWLCDASRKVVTNAIRSWGVTGRDNTLIGEAWELYDKTGQNTLAGLEIALITQPTPDGIHRRRGVLNGVLKGRMDNAPPGPQRDIPNSVVAWLSAQPELRGESIIGADPGALYGPAINFPHNPGASLCSITSDMLVVVDGRRCIPFLLDGKVVGIPFLS